MNLEHISREQIYSLAVKQKNKPAVYIRNNLMMIDDANIWERVIVIFNNNFEVLYKIFEGGLFFFNSGVEAQQFFDFFNDPLIYGSGLYASLYNLDGELITDNT